MPVQCAIAIIDLSLDNGVPYDTESNRSSVLFERSHTQRNKASDGEIFGKEDFIRISSLKNLLRLFRINLKDNDTFEFNGSKYLIDFDENLYGRLSSSPTFHHQVYLQQQPKSMPANDMQPTFSPILPYRKEENTGDDNALDSEDQEIDQKNHQVSFSGLKLGEDAKSQNCEKEIQVGDDDFKNIQNAQSSSTNAQLTAPAQEVKPEEKIQQIVEEIDTFYADIARQLALEIELEEAEAIEAEEEKVQQKQEEEQEVLMESPLLVIDKSQSENLGLVDRKRFQLYDSIQGGRTETHLTQSTNNLYATEQQRDSLAEISSQDKPRIRRFQTMGSANDKYLRLQKMNNEKQILMQQLNQAKEQLSSLSQHMQSLGVDKNLSDMPCHLAFLFASPLVLRQSGQTCKDGFNTVPLLDFSKEFQLIKESIRETKKNIKVRAKQATIENLTMVLTQNPLALHFSGHGIENNKENFGRQFKSRQGDGNYLLFESEDGEGELVSEKMLQEFIQSTNTNLEFVFVASCYSEFAGRIFLNAGAKHVICVKSGEEIADLAVLTFSKSFYNAVFSSNMTICDSFRMAQKQVQVKYGLVEANKFYILVKVDQSPQSSNKAKPLSALYSSQDSNITPKSTDTNHKCKNLGILKQGELEFLDPNPRFKEFPAKVAKFIGRQKEMFDIVQNIVSNRLVTVIGLPGIGKSSLCKNAVHYIAERRMFKQGIVFLPLKGYMSFELFMKKLVVNFVMSNFELDIEEKKDLRDKNIDDLLLLTLQYLKATEDNLLVVFDNVEDLLTVDKHAFRILINDLLVQIPNLHILMTSRTTLGALQDISEKILILQELSLFYTVELFISRSRDIPQEEIKELLEYQPENYILVNDSPPNKNHKIKNLSEHHFFKILGGNPHAVILAAPILNNMKLKELYSLLNSKEMHEVLQVDGIKDSTVASLRLSLEASIKVLREEDKEGLEFFFLIGMLPGGIEEEELQHIWAEGPQKHVEKLINLSLLSRKELPNEKTKLILPPFMIQYAEAKISSESRIEFQTAICHYYSGVCKKILNNNSKSQKKPKRQSELKHQVIEKLLKHETNIWACIHRMVDCPQHQNEEIVSQESLTKYVNSQMRRISTIIQSINPDQLERKSTTVEIDQMKQSSPKKVKSMKTKLAITKTSDQIEQRPFAVMQSQTPTSNQKGFSFPENQQKASQSVVQNSQGLNQIQEESGSESENNSDDSFKSDENIQDEQDIDMTQIHPGLSGQAIMSNKQSQVDHIIRNSNVNFYNPSHQQKGSAQLLQMVKSSENEKRFMQRRLTIAQQNIGERRNFKESSQTFQSFKKPRVKIEELHSAEELIIYYVMNLFLLRENENALNIINTKALKANGGVLYEANIYRVLGLIQHNNVQIEESLKGFKKAKELYRKVNSIYGIALCQFSIAYIQRSKITEIFTKTNEDVILERSKVGFERALESFEQLNHVVGMALCHQQLSLVMNKLPEYKVFPYKLFNNFLQKESMQQSKSYMMYMKMYTNYKGKNKTPHVQRVHGNEISLMSEIVLDNETKNLFPNLPQITGKKKSADISSPDHPFSQNSLKIENLKQHKSVQDDSLNSRLNFMEQDTLKLDDQATPNNAVMDTQVEDFEFFKSTSQCQEESNTIDQIINSSDSTNKNIAQETKFIQSQKTFQAKLQKVSKLDIVSEEVELIRDKSQNLRFAISSTKKEMAASNVSQRYRSQDKKETQQKTYELLEEKDREQLENLLNRSAIKPRKNPPKQIKTTILKQ